MTLRPKPQPSPRSWGTNGGRNVPGQGRSLSGPSVARVVRFGAVSPALDPVQGCVRPEPKPLPYPGPESHFGGTFTWPHRPQGVTPGISVAPDPQEGPKAHTPDEFLALGCPVGPVCTVLGLGPRGAWSDRGSKTGAKVTNDLWPSLGVGTPSGRRFGARDLGLFRPKGQTIGPRFNFSRVARQRTLWKGCDGGPDGPLPRAHCPIGPRCEGVGGGL